MDNREQSVERGYWWVGDGGDVLVAVDARVVVRALFGVLRLLALRVSGYG